MHLRGRNVEEAIQLTLQKLAMDYGDIRYGIVVKGTTFAKQLGSMDFIGYAYRTVLVLTERGGRTE